MSLKISGLIDKTPRLHHPVEKLRAYKYWNLMSGIDKSIINNHPMLEIINGFEKKINENYIRNFNFLTDYYI